MADPHYGGVYLIGGVDPHWRTLRAASRPDTAWAKVYRSFDAISPARAGELRDGHAPNRALDSAHAPRVGPRCLRGHVWRSRGHALHRRRATPASAHGLAQNGNDGRSLVLARLRPLGCPGALFG